MPQTVADFVALPTYRHGGGVTAESGDDGAAGWEPAFPGQRPPFAPGNTAALVHGAASERLLGPPAEQIAADLLASDDTPGHLREPAFAAAVSAWSRAEAVCVRLRDFLDGQSLEEALTEVTSSEEDEESGKGYARRTSTARRVAAALDMSRRWEAHAANLRSKLGLDPASAARVGRDLSQSRWFQSATPLDKRLAEIEAQRQAAIPAAANGTAPHPPVA